MSFDRFTIKAQEVVKNAFDLAQQHSHQQIEPEHLLQAILTTPDNVGVIVLKKIIENPAGKTDDSEAYSGSLFAGNSIRIF